MNMPFKDNEYLKKYMKNYYKDTEKRKKHIKQVVISHKKQRKYLKERIVQLLGSKCIHCGFSDPRALQIDHVHGNGRKERKNHNLLCYYRMVLKKVKAGSKDYQLLCANCNWIKRVENDETT